MKIDPRSACRLVLEQRSDELVSLSHRIHAEPGLAFAEHRSSAVAAMAKDGVAGLDTAFPASFGSGDLVVRLCAECDTLPGLGHPGGHNVIAAASAGAALALDEVADRLGSTVGLFGTPAEKTGGGKVLMLDRGVFDGVAMAMMVHPAPRETCAAPSLALCDLESVTLAKSRMPPTHRSVA